MDGSKPASTAYGWQHAAFALGMLALAASLAAGLRHALTGEGRLPALSLDRFAEARALEARGELRKALRRYETLALVAADDAQPWRKVAELAAVTGDRDAAARAERELARFLPRKAAGAPR